MLRKLLHLLIFQFYLFAEGDPENLLGGGDPPAEPSPEGDPPPEGTPPPAEPSPEGDPPANPESIYGDLQPKWPEGTPDNLKNEPSFKAFVNKETGDIDYPNLMKSFLHGQKTMGSNKVVIPGENATEQELNDFYAKVNKYDPNFENYGEIKRLEESTVSEELASELAKVLHSNRVPSNVAQQLVSTLEGKFLETQTDLVKKASEEITEGQEALRKEWGASWDENLKVANNYLKEHVDEDTMKYFDESGLAADARFTKFINGMAKLFYSGEGTSGPKGPSGPIGMTPEQARVQINEVMADAGHPYHNPNDPRNEDAKKDMQKLFELKNS